MQKLFTDLSLSRSLLKALDEIGFTQPTPVQEKVVPVIFSGANVVGIAQTGTGKTAAYLLPLLTRLGKAEGTEPRAIILLPTRELSIQVGADIEMLTTYSNLRFAAVFGGIGWTRHAELIRPGIDLLAATPGRLWDLYQCNAVSLRKVKYLVIDEADRMLDMGFMPQLRQLFEIIPPKRQNMLFSATFSERVEKMAEEFLDHFEKVEVDPSASPVELIDQQLYNALNYRTKLNLIIHLLSDEESFSRVIIFVNTKEAAEEIYSLTKRKVKGEIRIMHSNKGQTTRMNTMRDFKNGEIRVLITTDMSARGLDVHAVSHVVNFNLPPQYEDYIHRIGRTARAGKTGTAITMITPDDEWHLRRIEKMMGRAVPVFPLPTEVKVEETPFEEKQLQLREIDRQRKIDNPSFKGAFHEKKKRHFSSSKQVDNKKKRKRN